jgi:hypothetical protein
VSDIQWWVYLAVLGGLLLVSFLLHVLVRVAARPDTPAKKHGMMALFIGLDDRTSTSKLQPLLWTYAILWALISLLAGGGVEEFEEALGQELGEEYFLLLGGPYLVAIASKAKTTSDVNRAAETGAEDPKPRKSADVPSGPKERIAEIVTNDEGSVDLGDFQYAAFTLLTLTFFVWAFIASPSEGLPAIPGTLLVLTGVSQAAYLGKKVLIPPPRVDGRMAPPPASSARRRPTDRKAGG